MNINTRKHEVDELSQYTESRDGILFRSGINIVKIVSVEMS